ncbi:MAG: lysylphosphatidylglycerol synthase transmembrane domain-containing protein [Candidatus Neomarinimicrobiota bacterium]
MNRAVKFGLGLLISLAGLFYAFGKVDFPVLWNKIQQVNFWYLFLVILLIVFSIAVRAKRWQMLLTPLEKISFHPLFGATMIGYFGNGVLPFRLGEILRAYSLNKKTGLETSSVFGTIILERILDLLGLVVFTLFIAVFYPFKAWGGNILPLIIFTGVGAFGFIFILERKSAWFFNYVSQWKTADNFRIKKILILLEKIIRGLTSIRRSRQLLEISVYTLFLWAIYFAMVYFTVQAVKIDLDWTGAGVVLISTTLAISVPAAPGFVGTYHAAAIYVLTSLFNIQLGDAQAFAIILHAVGFLPLLIIGFVYFLLSGIHLSDSAGKEIIS